MKKALSIVSIFVLSTFLLTVDMEGASVRAVDVHEVWEGQSIQDAIDAANPGDTILVHNGIYDESITINKALHLAGEDRDSTIIQGISSPQSLSVVTILAANVTATGLTIKKGSTVDYTSGVLVASDGNIISNNKIISNYYGLRIYASSGNLISNNLISQSDTFGIVLERSNGNFLSENIVSRNREGIRLSSADNNVLYENTISDNDVGLSISTGSDTNTLFHNNFLDGVIVSNVSSNFWSSRNEGNYWVDYTGHDVNGDGIGEEPYTGIGGENEDHYPLMGLFSKVGIALRGGTYYLTTICNSSISAFEFEVGVETGNKLLHLNVTDGSESVGFCRITIPTDLMDYPFIVIDAEEEISPTVLAISNQSHAYLYFTFVRQRQSQTITIISSVTMRYFNELQEKYLSLQSELDSVNATYYAVLDSYRSVFQSDIDDLNATYQNLMDGYTSLTYNYTQLQQDYFALNSSFREISSDFSESMQNLRNIAYIFAVTTAIFLAAIVYLSKAANGRRQSQDLH